MFKSIPSRVDIKGSICTFILDFLAIGSVSITFVSKLSHLGSLVYSKKKLSVLDKNVWSWSVTCQKGWVLVENKKARFTSYAVLM